MSYRSPSLYAYYYIHMHPSDWRSVASQISMCPAKPDIRYFAGHKIDCWLAISRQENIVSLKDLSGYNHTRITRETCILALLVMSRQFQTRVLSRWQESLSIQAGCQNWLFYICLLIFYFWNCIHSHLARGDFFLASDSEPAIYVSGKAGHHIIILARYRSPAKNGRK